MTKDAPGGQAIGTKTSSLLTTNLLMTLLLLIIPGVLKLKSGSREMVRMTQEKFTCQHLFNDERLIESDRLKYRSTYSCPIDFFENAHFVYENRHMSHLFDSSLILALNYQDKSGILTGQEVKFSLQGNIYLIPKEANKPLLALPAMERPVTFRFSGQNFEENSEHHKSSKLLKLNQLSLMPEMDYEFKIVSFDLYKQISKKNYTSVFDDQLFFSFSLYKIDHQKFSGEDLLTSTSRWTSLIGAIGLLIWSIFKTGHLELPKQLLTAFRLSLFFGLFKEILISEILVSPFLVNYSTSIKLTSLFCYKASLTLLLYQFTACLLSAWLSSLALFLQNLSFFAWIGYGAFSFLANLDSFESKPTVESRLGLYKKLEMGKKGITYVAAFVILVLAVCAIVSSAKKKTSSGAYLVCLFWTFTILGTDFQCSYTKNKPYLYALQNSSLIGASFAISVLFSEIFAKSEDHFKEKKTELEQNSKRRMQENMTKNNKREFEEDNQEEERQSLK